MFSTIRSTRKIVGVTANLARRFYATEVAKYPGATNASYTNEVKFVKGHEPFPVFRVMNGNGEIVNPDQFPKELDNDTVVRMYNTMVRLNVMDTILYDIQRQGRVSFYMTNYGEEAVQVASIAALKPNDEVFAQYREAGVLMHRGFTLDEFMNQCFSTKDDYGKGRQMPVHYGSAKLHFQTISSPLGTQLPQAAGAAYAFKLAKEDRVVICYFGEGAASEGDFHPALNFAATLECPVIFLCRNNGYAISTPTEDQYRGDGIAARGVGYGIETIRVDGNDLFAVFNATKRAREIASTKNCPVLIEAMTYRGGHHSTSDDASRYRKKEEVEYWTEQQNPIKRLRKYLTSKNLWDDAKEEALRTSARQEVLAAVDRAENAEKPHFDELFNDVYDALPENLKEQKRELEEHIAKYPDFYTHSH